ncbi:MAG: Putative cation efflux system protein [candidate division TA06 bacterium 34_109]|uniref:Putative cation efflux system protein n=1 Tax=candidate division TA06 bacterium 34_109 TaxID=1635277 RepID=A0A101HZJ6_UNCT6|nr:MAG: Putative cation efflux system protein [candidate division TA06 bacterium 34_109]
MKSILRKIINYILFVFFKEKNLLNKKEVNPELRKKYAYLEAWLSIISNLVLSLIMALFGFALNSIALLANATHTASDVLSSFVVLLGFKFSSMPADEKHPFGHGRIEFLATMIISILLVIIGIEFGIKAYYRYIANSVVKGNYLVIILMVLAALFKEWLGVFSEELGKQANTSVLIADAWHHKTDGVAMFLVAISILSSKFGYYRVDAVFGIIIAILIIYAGINLLKESISKLIGEEPEKETLKEIKESVNQIPEVVSTHKLKIHDYGPYKEITIHIQLSSDIGLVEAHEISERVERLIESKINCKVTVHAEPIVDLSRY